MKHPVHAEALSVNKKCPKCAKMFRKRGAFTRHYRRAHDTAAKTWKV